MITGFVESEPAIAAKWSATWPTDLPASTSGWALASATVSGSSGHPGVSAAYPAASNRSAHRSQLLGSRNRPWTNITGVSPEAFARSTCPLSCSVIVVVVLDLSADMKVPPQLRCGSDQVERGFE